MVQRYQWRLDKTVPRPRVSCVTVLEHWKQKTSADIAATTKFFNILADVRPVKVTEKTIFRLGDSEVMAARMSSAMNSSLAPNTVGTTTWW